MINNEAARNHFLSHTHTNIHIHTNKQTNKQTNTHTYTHTHYSNPGVKTEKEKVSTKRYAERGFCIWWLCLFICIGSICTILVSLQLPFQLPLVVDMKAIPLQACWNTAPNIWEK
jgi:hypothetical protein